MATHLTVLVRGGVGQLLRRRTHLCTDIRSLVPESHKVYIAFDPSIQSQLSNSNVAAWTKVCSSLYSSLGTNLDLFVQFLDQTKSSATVIDLDKLSDSDALEDLVSLSTDRLYKNVCLGGTFDKLHAGHKILLSTGLLRASEYLVVGVTAPELLGKKTLCELIEPLPQRIAAVKEFLSAVNRNIKSEVVEIRDPFGPAITDPSLECIVGSEETRSGCEAVNSKRVEAGMKKLDIHVIQLVQDTNRQGNHEEEKISSSSARTRILGHRLRAARRPWDRTKGPYIVGLTGGSASGKSSIGKRFESLGAGLVDCDQLGHMAYLPGSPSLAKIVQEFGKQVLSEDGTINRKVLGAIVFSDRSKRNQLENIVWPEIARMAQQKMEELWKLGREVVILDAAVLLEAGWQELCHEVWVCVIPRSEAVTRIVERDRKSIQEAENRIDSQLSNADRCKEGNTVFCSLWDYPVTQKQVELAWTRLTRELCLRTE